MTCTFIRRTPFSHQTLFKVRLKGGSLTQVSLYTLLMENGNTFYGGISDKIDLPPPKNGSSLKRKNWLPVGANSFLLEWTPFSEGGLVCGEANRKLQNSYHCENWRKINLLCPIPLNKNFYLQVFTKPSKYCLFFFKFKQVKFKKTRRIL